MLLFRSFSLHRHCIGRYLEHSLSFRLCCVPTASGTKSTIPPPILPCSMLKPYPQERKEAAQRQQAASSEQGKRCWALPLLSCPILSCPVLSPLHAIQTIIYYHYPSKPTTSSPLPASTPRPQSADVGIQAPIVTAGFSPLLRRRGGGGG